MTIGTEDDDRTQAATASVHTVLRSLHLAASAPGLSLRVRPVHLSSP